MHCRVYAKVPYAELLPAYWFGRLIGTSPTDMSSYFIDAQVSGLLVNFFILFTLYLLAFFEADYRRWKSYSGFLIFAISPAHAVYGLVVLSCLDCVGYHEWKQNFFQQSRHVSFKQTPPTSPNLSRATG